MFIEKKHKLIRCRCFSIGFVIVVVLFASVVKGEEIKSGNTSLRLNQAQQRISPGARPSASYIGIAIQDIEMSNLDAQSLPIEGAVIKQVSENSPASEAGFEQGDIVVEFDQQRIRSSRQMSRLVKETPPGRTVEAIVVRDGSRVQLDVTPELGKVTNFKGPLSQDFSRIERHQHRRRQFLPKIRQKRGQVFRAEPQFNPRPKRFGVRAIKLTSQISTYFGVENGVLVMSVAADSVAAEAGLKAGDIITELNSSMVNDVRDLLRHIRTIDSGVTFKISVVRDRSTKIFDGRFKKEKRPRRRHQNGPLI